MEGSDIRHKPDAVARCDHPAKILSIIIQRQPGVPRSCSLSQFARHEPSRGRHVEILPHLPNEPFNWRKIAPERGRSEVGFIDSIIEGCPGGREKRPFAAAAI